MKKALGPGDWSEGLAAKYQPKGGTDGENSPAADYGDGLNRFCDGSASGVYRHFAMPRTAYNMVIYHAHRLHEGIADRRADKLETFGLQRL